MDKMTRKYQLITYDVWGNDDDGYVVNDVFPKSQYVELSDELTDSQIIDACIQANIIMGKELDRNAISIEGEFGCNLWFSFQGKPEFELRNVEL